MIGDVEILRGVDAGIPGGEITAVVGPSGAGKSTLLRAIGLLEAVLRRGLPGWEPTRSLDPLALRRRGRDGLQIPTLFGDSVEEAVLQGASLW